MRRNTRKPMRMGNKSNFYSNPPLPTPDLPEPKSTPTQFHTPEPSGIKPTTEFQKIRNFDAKLDRIDINIKGAAPIYGDQNNIKSYTLGTEVGNFTGSLNNVYFNDEFNLLSTVSRKATLYYWGINTGIEKLVPRPITDQPTYTEPTKVIQYKAYDTWIRNVAGLVTMLRQSMYTDLNIFNWYYINTRTQQDGEATFTPAAYDYVFSDPIAQMLINYQHDIQLVLMLVFRFEYLTAILPKLTTLYRKKADMFIYLQQQLRRSLYTASIKSLMMWLKQRYVDKKYITDYVLPLTILSKATDGLNSPIYYLSLINKTPVNCVHYDNNNVPYLPVHIGTHNIQVSLQQKNFTYDIRNGSNAISQTEWTNAITEGGSHQETFALVKSTQDDLQYGSLTREMNAFDISTLLITIEKSDTFAEFKTSIDKWLEDAQNTIKIFQTQTLDMVRSQQIIDLETAIAKLASEPGGILWQQNIEFSSLVAIEKFDNWTLVSDLVTFNASLPVYYENGYKLRIPMYTNRGISTNEMKTYSQAWFLPSDDRFMSFLHLDDRISYTKRGSTTIYYATVEYIDEAGYKMPKLRSTNSYDDVFVVTTLPFQQFEFINNQWKNPYSMAYIVATFDNKWPEFVIEAMRSFIVPQG